MKTHWMLHRYWTLECVVSLRCNLWVKSQNLQTHNLAPLLVCKISSCLPICGVQGLVQQLRLPNLCQNQRWQLIGMQACGTCQVFNCEVLLMCCVDIKQHKLRFSMLYCCTKSQERVKQLMPHLGWNVENEQILWAVGSQRKVKPMCVPLYLFNTSPCVGLNTAPCVCVGLNWVESVQSAPPFVAGTHRSEWSRWNWKGCWQSSKRNQGGGKSGFDEISSCKEFGSVR